MATLLKAFPEASGAGVDPSAVENSEVTISDRRNRSLWYYLFLAGLTGILLCFLSLIHVRGAYHFPPGFGFFRRLFYVQYALFIVAMLTGIVFVFRGTGVVRRTRWAVLAVFYFCFSWVVLWCLVHRTFGIELTPALIIQTVFNAAPISEMGVARDELVTVFGLTGVVMLVGTAITGAITRRAGPASIRNAFIAVAGAFLIVHAAVRIYFAWQIAHRDYAALAYDDAVPFPLRTERLIPGVRAERIKMPNYASPGRTRTYLAAVQRNESLTVPHPRNILFLNVESLRFDGITEEAMPRLSSYRHYFQIRQTGNHWSGANATHMAIFSMLTGVSGHYVPAFRYAGVSDPFLGLLLHNDYRVRIGKKAHIESADLPGLIPAAAVVCDVDVTIHGGDSLMVDRYLEDRESRAAGPSFDFLAFDATHWPYSFDQQDLIYRPLSEAKSAEHALLSSYDLESVRHRYKNGCHCVDRQIGRVLDDLEKRHGFKDTIVLVLGDHGEEFQERGQMTHSAVSNDFQGRTVLWMHLPDRDETDISVNEPTTHLDIVPTVLQALGFEQDVLFTQGNSLLSPLPKRPLLSLAEQGGLSVPLYRCLVSPEYISSWRYGPSSYRFCAVQRRDGQPVHGQEWLEEVRAGYDEAARMYDLLPDVSASPPAFAEQARPATRAAATPNE